MKTGNQTEGLKKHVSVRNAIRSNEKSKQIRRQIINTKEISSRETKKDEKYRNMAEFCKSEYSEKVT